MAQQATWRYICWDILSILKKTTASSDLGFSQVLFWASSIANRLRHQHIGKNPTGRYLNIFTGIPIQNVGTSANPNVVKNRKLIVLPAPVYDYINEKGISYICHAQDESCPPEFLNQNFQPTTPAKAARLTYSPYENPGPNNVYFYRVENIVYFLGLEFVNIYTLEMGLYTSLEMRTNLVNPDDICDLTEQHLTILRQELLQLGSFAFAVPKDRINDAADSMKENLRVKPIQTGFGYADTPSNQSTA